MMILKSLVREFLIYFFPKMIINHRWNQQMGYPINWKQPRDLNEKIQWLLINSDITEWTRLADKIKVRDFVRNRGLGNILIKQYGVWTNADNIDFEQLPQRFVLKCNHDSGSTIIVNKDCDNYNPQEIRLFFNKRLHLNYGLNGEKHYCSIPRRIIAEEFLELDENRKNTSTSLIDYKIWCFNGKPYCIHCFYNREKESVYTNIFDLNWHVRFDATKETDHYHVGNGRIPKPDSFQEMINSASILSKGFPEVRVDFYEAYGRLYFGEMTFTSMCGRMKYYTPEFLIELGNQVLLPNYEY